MTADYWLVLIFGMLAGFCFGYLHAWRQARKLEHHGVRLWAWDEHFDPKAPRDEIGKVIGKIG